MSFPDTVNVGELSLTDRVRIREGEEWVTGKVIELALIGDDMEDVRVTLRLDNGTELMFDRTPDTTVIMEWSRG